MKIILDALAQIATAAVSAAIIILIRYGIRYISTKINNEKIRMALQELQTVLVDGVQYTEQTFVSAMKEKGEWNADSQKAALQQAAQYIIKNLTQSTLDLLTNEKDDIETWVSQKIESYLCSIKQK